MSPVPKLMILCGLPGTGKSTIGWLLARRLKVPFLRIDSVEQAVRDAGELADGLRTTGYVTGYAVAADQLRVGLDVLVECVNPLRVTREAWRHVAVEAGARIHEIELVCSDLAQHRERVEQRESDVPGLVKPDWRAVLDRHYEPWDRPHLTVDTTRRTPSESADDIVAGLAA